MNIQNYLDHFQKTDAFSRNMNVIIRSLTEEQAEVELTVSDDHKNYMGLLHGGALFTMADIAAGLCVACRGEHCVTLSSSINYLKGTDAGKVIARAQISRRGRKICVCDVRIYSETEVLLCTATFTMYMRGIPIEF